MIPKQVALWAISGLLVLTLVRVAAFHLQVVPALEEVRDGGGVVENTEFGLLGGYTAHYLGRSDAVRMLPLARWIYASEAVSGLWLLIGLFVALRNPMWGIKMVAPAPFLTFPFLLYAIPTVGEDLYAYHFFFAIPSTTSPLAPMVWVVAYFFFKEEKPDPD